MMAKKPSERAREANAIISNISGPYDYKKTQKKLEKSVTAKAEKSISEVETELTSVQSVTIKSKRHKQVV